ncbi:MAG: sulfatase [Tunicatimonas sp.]
MFTHRLLFLLPLATSFLLSCQSQSADEANVISDVPPNIIFLLTDDQRWDAAGFMGNDIVQTPHLDSLAAQGTVFENAYVTTAICAISRASILTGQYASRHGVLDFDTSLSDSAFRQTYPAQLQQAGYYTGFVGKYGIGTLDSVTARQRFDQWYGFNGQGQYEHTDEDGNYRHLTTIMGDESLAFLGNVPSNKPFCLSVSFKAPHVQDVDPRQFVYDTAYTELYAEATIPVPETADPRYFEQLPEYLQTSEARHRWQRRFATPEAYQESVKGYYRLITGVDGVVGRIRDALRRLGRADNTVIVLIGDNGFYLGEHGLAGKWYGHEESIRVPLLYYDSRRPEAQRRDEIALNVDIAPTLLEAAGVSVPSEMQGRSLLPLIRGEKPEDWRTDFYYEHAFDVQKLIDEGRISPERLWPIPRSEGVVSLDWKYLRYYDYPSPNEELYNLADDPQETTNLANDAAHQAEKDRLVQRMNALHEAAK